MSKVAKKVEGANESKTGRKVKKILTLPVFSLKDEGTVLAVKILEPLYVGKPQQNGKEGEKPADICHVLNLDSGEMGQIIVPAMVKSKLEEYGNESYVDLCFELENLGKIDGKGGKRYNSFRVLEIEE